MKVPYFQGIEVRAVLARGASAASAWAMGEADPAAPDCGYK